jgi:hypothetical protein
VKHFFLQSLVFLTLASCRHEATAPDVPVQHDISVLLFIAPDCPISNAYIPEFNRIAAEYGGRGVSLTGVYCDPHLSSIAMHKHAEEYGLAFPVLLDEKQNLARRVGATITPQAAVLDSSSHVVYVGRIDDLFVTFGKRRVKPTTHDLRDAIDAVLDGRPIPKPAAPPIGCDLPPRG